MKITHRYSFIEVIGGLWMPCVTGATRYPLSSYDIDNMRDDDGAITRESVDLWLTSHAGDFRSVDDFHASIEDGEATIDIPWSTEESEFTYSDCMYPSED